MKNPVPILYQHCGVKVSTVSPLFPPGTPLEIVHQLFTDKPIDARLHRKLQPLALTHWGQHPERHVRRLLWNCYFEGYRPHIFHILAYRCSIPVSTLALQSSLSQRQIEKNLTRPRVLRNHLQAIARYATLLEEAYRSPKTWDGVNPVYMEIHRALRDPKRIKPFGSLTD